MNQDESNLSSDPLEPGLYIVATPIGNLGDISLRAIAVLKACDSIACEDTRVSAKLLAHLGIKAHLLRYDDHAGERERAHLIELMQHGAVALVSDAGTPLISDPGYRLVKAAREAGVRVTSIPGPSALITALTIAGLPSDRFVFGGFLPAREKAREKALDEFAGVKATLIFYESARRLEKSLAAIAERLPDREVAVARELTKLHEECRSGSPEEVLQYYRTRPPRGEVVLMVGPPKVQGAQFDDAEVTELLREALATHKPSQAAAEVARLTGRDRKALYANALDLRKK